MATLSLCMIVKNEEDVLGRCLKSVEGIFDEIIIVDTGSTDRTKEIALQFTTHVYDFKWCDDFSAARNFSFSKATMEYTMWLDADDVVCEWNRDMLYKLKNTLTPEIDIVMMKYDVAFDSQGNPTYSYYRERIFKTAKNYRWKGEVHEVIEPVGTVVFSEIRIQHRKIKPTERERNLKIYEKVLNKGKTLDPRQKFYYARELMYNGKYNSAIREFLLFLNDDYGWVENKISACKDLAHCYYSINKNETALQSLLWSFMFDEPRAEICCDIGKHFFDKGEYCIAIFWYKVAANRKINDKNCGFYIKDCYGYIPSMQLCVCYDRLGKHKKAKEWNEKAGLLKPNDQNYLYNKKYFKRIFNMN